MQENAHIPAFLGKLWKMVNDPSTDHLICWSQAGNTFIIQNQAQFWYELLPVYYKHNNMSSFVRQLNMYGFHKISSLENPGIAVGSDKDDTNTIQFYHPCFQKDEPEKLSNIKRKGTSSKPHDVQGVIRNDDLSKVLTDIKQLRGKQSSVDSQLSAMKQENAVLWRELAMLRQKHMKQQQIVNKLIQFLVTLVQPTASQRISVGVKRRMPLMLHESPMKKAKGKKNSRQHNDAGPTIHELDPEVDLSPEQLLEEAAVIDEEEIPLVDSPGSQTTPVSSTAQPMTSSISPVSNIQNEVTKSQQQSVVNNATFWDEPEFVSIDDANDDVSENEDDLINTLHKSSGSGGKVFLNTNNRDTLIGGIINSGTFNVNIPSGKLSASNKKQPNNKQSLNPPGQHSMQIATKKPTVKISNGTYRTNECFSEDLDLHLGHTENELDQLKDILNGCSTFDANTLLGLFSDNDPEYALRNNTQNKENSAGDEGNALVSSEAEAPASNLIDFNELFDADLTNQEASLGIKQAILNTPAGVLSVEASSLDTPLMIKNEPSFPSNT